MSGPSIKPSLSFLGQSGDRAGEDRFSLLDAIDRLGSIAAAAKQVGLSYKGAWDAVNALNNLFPKPLVIKHPGGKHGGGALVTEDGKRALAAHRHLTESLGQILAEFEASLATPSAPLLWSFAMRTSARNTFHGVVTSVKSGPINAEIGLKISETTTLAVVITNHSAEALGLVPGRQAFALIKASTPILMPQNEAGRTSARNRICGTVIAVEHGAVSAEVVLDIGAGKTLATIVTNDSAESLDFKPGDRVCALIKSSHIILGVE